MADKNFQLVRPTITTRQYPAAQFPEASNGLARGIEGLSRGAMAISETVLKDTALTVVNLMSMILCVALSVRQLPEEIRRRRVERARPPGARLEIHEIHARGVAGIDGGVCSDQQRREKRAHQMNARCGEIVIW